MEMGSKMKKLCNEYNIYICPNSSINGAGNQVDFQGILIEASQNATKSGTPAVLNFVFLNTNNLDTFEVKNIIFQVEIPILPAYFKIEENTLPYIKKLCSNVEQIDNILYKYIINDKVLPSPDEQYQSEVQEKRKDLENLFSDLADFSLTNAVIINPSHPIKMKSNNEVNEEIDKFLFDLQNLNFSTQDLDAIVKTLSNFTSLTNEMTSANQSFFNNHVKPQQPLNLEVLTEKDRQNLANFTNFITNLYTNYLLYELALKENMAYEFMNDENFEALKNLNITDLRDLEGNVQPHEQIFFTKFIKDRYQDIAPHVSYVRKFLDMYIHNMKAFGSYSSQPQNPTNGN